MLNDLRVNISVDARQAIAALGEVPEAIKRRAIGPALNKVGDKARTEMVRAITSQYNIKGADVRARLRVIRATRTEATVILDPFAGSRRGRSLNLIRFLEKKTTLAQAKKYLPTN